MLRMLKQIWTDEQGQDLIEYTLLLAFVTLVAAGVFVNVGSSISTMWTNADSKINAVAKEAVK